MRFPLGWLVLVLVILNLVVYWQPEKARQLYRLLVSGGEPEQTIELLAERDQRLQAEQLAAEVANDLREQGETPVATEKTAVAGKEEKGATDEGEEPVCWLVSVDSSASLGADAGQEILQTLQQKFRALEVSAEPLASGQLQVPDSDYHKLSAQLWDRIREDWPEVIRQKKPCQSVAQ